MKTLLIVWHTRGVKTTQLAEAVKRSRELALIPYAGEPANEGTRPRRGRDRDRDRD